MPRQSGRSLETVIILRIQNRGCMYMLAEKIYLCYENIYLVTLIKISNVLTIILSYVNKIHNPLSCKCTYVPKAALVLLRLDMAWKGINIFYSSTMYILLLYKELLERLIKTDNYILKNGHEKDEKVVKRFPPLSSSQG